jgi:hypothetical protein
VKIIPLNQQDANDLLALITSQSLTVTANSVPRVHQLQALLSNEPLAVFTLAELQALADTGGDVSLRTLMELSGAKTP